MVRKCVIVANQTFDLGLVELEKQVRNTDGKLQPWEIDVAGTVFVTAYSIKEKSFLLNWWGSTSYKNILWTRFLIFSLSRRPVRKVECFTYAKEGV